MFREQLAYGYERDTRQEQILWLMGQYGSRISHECLMDFYCNVSLMWAFALS
jgi:hypothetical protein